MKKNLASSTPVTYELSQGHIVWCCGFNRQSIDYSPVSFLCDWWLNAISFKRLNNDLNKTNLWHVHAVYHRWRIKVEFLEGVEILRCKISFICIKKLKCVKMNKKKIWFEVRLLPTKNKKLKHPHLKFNFALKCFEKCSNIKPTRHFLTSFQLI